MKTRRLIARHFLRHRSSERGLATVVLIALLGIMLVLVTATTVALWHLKRDLQLVEQQQQRAWEQGRMPLRSAAPAESPVSPAETGQGNVNRAD